MYILFNRYHEVVGYSPDIPDTPNLNIFKVKIPEDQRDLTKWKWQGDMLTGKMVKIDVEK